MKQYAKDGTRLRDPDYLAWIRERWCICSGIDGLPLGQCFGSVVPAHGKPWGRSMKGPDYEALPMCFKHHNEEHSGLIKIADTARSKMVDVFNKKYCDDAGTTIEDLRGRK